MLAGTLVATSASPQTGEICLDILKTAWSPAWTLASVCQAVLALMSAPAPDSPLNCDAGVPPELVGSYDSVLRFASARAPQLCPERSTHIPFGRLHVACPTTHAHTGNLLRANDVRGYNSMARMYTLEHASQAPART